MLLRVGVLLAALASAAFAGGGPETTLVVVNGASPVSRLVAHEYVRLRDIPRSNIVYLNHVPHLGVITLDEFRQHIWKPVKAHIDEHCSEIRLITYSADFPYGVRFKSGKDFANEQERMVVGGIASLNGVTYLVGRLDEQFWNLSDRSLNPYYGLATPNRRVQPRRATNAETAHYQRAMAALNQRDYRTAAAAFGKMLETYDQAPQPWYNYACCLARLKKGDEAIAALKKAVATGWSDAGHTAQDPDLAFLRLRKDFKAVLASMDGKVKPAAPFAIDGMYLSTHLGYTGRYGNTLSEVLACLRRAAASDGTRPDGTVYFLKNGNVRSKTREPFLKLLESGLKARDRRFRLMEGILPKDRPDVIGAVIGTAKFDWPKCGSTMLPGAIVEHLTSFGAHFGTAGQTKLSEFIRAGAAGSSGTVMEPLALHQKFPNPVMHLFYADGCSLAEAFFRSVHSPYQLMVVGDGLARPFAKQRKVEVRGDRIFTRPGARFEYWIDGKRVAGDWRKRVDSAKDVRVVAIHDPVDTRSYARVKAEDPPLPAERVAHGDRASPAQKKPEQMNTGMRGTVNGKPALVADLTKLRGKVDAEGLFHVEREGIYQFVARGAAKFSLWIDGAECARDLVGVPAAFVAVRLATGWHALRIVSEGPLEIMLGGDRVLAPLTVMSAARRFHKRQPTYTGDLKSGLIVSWKRTAAGVVALGLRGKKGKAGAKNFTVEYTTGRKYKPVKGFAILNAGVFVEIAFEKPMRARSFRIRADGDFVVTHVDANR